MEGEEMDAQEAARLRTTLARVPKLWDRSLHVEQTRRLPGSLAAADAHLPEARFVRLHAGQGLMSALDHLMAWKIIADGPLHPIQAQATLLRGTLEGSARCRWLVDSSVDAMTRVARGWAAKREDYLERKRFEEADADPDVIVQVSTEPRAGMTGAERLEALDKSRDAAGVPIIVLNRTDEMRTFGLEGMYRLMSGFAHAMEWIFPAHRIEQAIQVEDGVAGGLLAANNETVYGMTVLAIASAEDAVAAFECYFSVPVPDPPLR